MLSVLSFSIISCKEEVDFKSGNTKKSNKILINNVGINVISYQDIDGQECEILEFASTIDFDLTLSYLDAKAMEYEDYIDDNYGDLSEEEFWNKFIGFIESNNWLFGGGVNEIIDGFYINADGTKGKHVLDE